jgi:hypothetical protein
MQPIGDLVIRVDAEARVVHFHSSARYAQLPVVLLAQLDRCVFRWSVGAGLSAPQRRLLAGVRALLDDAADDDGWSAEPGEATRRLLTVGRDRLGVTYTFASSIGGPDDGSDDPEVCLALLRVGLDEERPDAPRLARALQAYCDTVERSGRSNGSPLRRAARLLG